MNKLLATLSLIIITAGCTTPGKFYENLPVGKIEGEISLQWRYDEDKSFLYEPHETNRLKYTTSEGDVIVPGEMWTDGGSIPRIVSIDKYFTSWRFAPAYLIHDWLFELSHCGYNPGGKYDYVKAAQIMAEAIKTQLVQEGIEPGIRNKIAIYEIYGFVKGFSKGLFDPYSKDSACDVPDTYSFEADGYVIDPDFGKEDLRHEALHDESDLQ